MTFWSLRPVKGHLETPRGGHVLKVLAAIQIDPRETETIDGPMLQTARPTERAMRPSGVSDRSLGVPRCTLAAPKLGLKLPASGLRFLGFSRVLANVSNRSVQAILALNSRGLQSGFVASTSDGRREREGEPKGRPNGSIEAKSLDTCCEFILCWRV